MSYCDSPLKKNKLTSTYPEHSCSYSFKASKCSRILVGHYAASKTDLPQACCLRLYSPTFNVLTITASKSISRSYSCKTRNWQCHCVLCKNATVEMIQGILWSVHWVLSIRCCECETWCRRSGLRRLWRTSLHLGNRKGSSYQLLGPPTELIIQNFVIGMYFPSTPLPSPLRLTHVHLEERRRTSEIYVLSNVYSTSSNH